MAGRQTLNVSLPSRQERFIRAQVKAGKYRTASEVVREGLRLLEETEHRRLLEKWLYEGLSKQEKELLPGEMIENMRSYFQKLVDDAERSGEEKGWIDAATVRARLAARLKGRLKTEL